MKPSFNIFTAGTTITGCSLLIEIGCQGISYIAVDENNNCFLLSVYHFTGSTTFDGVANHLKDIVTGHAILQQPFKKINIIYAFSEATLVPHQFMNMALNKNMLELVYGDTSESIVHSDLLDKHNLCNVYTVPKQIDSVIANLFPQAAHHHLYSLLPDVVTASGNLLYCVFSTTQLTVQLFKKGRLQVIQTFKYKVQEDAAYHLLNVCYWFEVDINYTVLYLNGMVDINSGLSNELHCYFQHIIFAELPSGFTYSDKIKQYPVHYFSHLFQLAACV